MRKWIAGGLLLVLFVLPAFGQATPLPTPPTGPSIPGSKAITLLASKTTTGTSQALFVGLARAALSALRGES